MDWVALVSQVLDILSTLFFLNEKKKKSCLWLSFSSISLKAHYYYSHISFSAYLSNNDQFGIFHWNIWKMFISFIKTRHRIKQDFSENKQWKIVFSFRENREQQNLLFNKIEFDEYEILSNYAWFCGSFFNYLLLGEKNLTSWWLLKPTIIRIILSPK